MPPKETTKVSSGRAAAFTSGTGAVDPTVKSVATDLAKAAPGAAWNALKREADYLGDGDYKVRATGHAVNFLSDIAQGVSNVSINAVNALSSEASKHIGDGRPAAVIPNIRTPKLNVDSTTRNMSVAGGSLERNPAVGTAKSLGFYVEGDPMETVSRGIEGAGLIPFLKPIKAAKGATNAITNEVANATKATAGSVKPKVSPKDVTPNTLAPKNQGEILPPKGVKPTFEPRTPGGPTTPKITRIDPPDAKAIDPKTGDILPPKGGAPRTLDKPDGPAKGQEKKTPGNTLTKDKPGTNANTREGRGLRPGDVESQRGVQGGTPETKPQGPRIKPKPVPKPKAEPAPAPAPVPVPKPASEPKPSSDLAPKPSSAPAVAPTTTLVRNAAADAAESARESRRLFPSMGVSPQSSQFTSPESSTDSGTKTDNAPVKPPKPPRRRDLDLPDIGFGKQDVKLQRIN